jgi:hypothetical protein
VGPPQLKLPTDWPCAEQGPDEEIVIPEIRKSIVTLFPCSDDKTGWYYVFSNNYDKGVHVLAWVIQLVNCCKPKLATVCGVVEK